jgi:hypothetical protein
MVTSIFEICFTLKRCLFCSGFRDFLDDLLLLLLCGDDLFLLLWQDGWQFLYGSLFLDQAHLRLFWEQNWQDIGDDSAFGNGNLANKLAQLFVVADGEQDVAGNYAFLSKVSCDVASQLHDFSSEILHDGSAVYGGT